MFEDIVAAYPDDEFLQYRYRENPLSLEIEYWHNHFEMNFFKEWCPITERVLDYGCGTGCMTELLRRDGYDIYGYDSSKGSIAIARRSGPEGHYYYTFPTQLKYTRAWMCHVLEHIPTSGFAKLFKSFRCGVQLLISVPHAYAYDDNSGHHVQHWNTPQELRDAISPYIQVDWVEQYDEYSVLRAQVTTCAGS